MAAVADGLGARAGTLVVPGWAIRLLGPVVPLLRELRETLYQWDRPFLVDDGAFRARFPRVGSDVAGVVKGVVAAVAGAA